MSEFAQYPYEELQSVGSHLSAISDQLGSKSGGAFDVMGMTADQDRINGAIEHFRSEWQASIRKLGDNIGGFGDTSSRIGAMSAQFDQELARSLDPGGAR